MANSQKTTDMTVITTEKIWVDIAAVTDFVPNSGRAILHNGEQIAVFNFNLTDWYATANQCPHKKQNLLARGLIGNQCDLRKVACPLHKNSFNLETGEHLGGTEAWRIETYEIKVEDGRVYLFLNQPLPIGAD